MREQVLIKPVVSEKTVANGQNGKYTFVVPATVTKVAIAQYILATYGVKPSKINIIKQVSKTRRVGRRVVTKRKNEKRVIITLPKDTDIDFTKAKPKKKAA